MSVADVISLLGGIALFLFGMSLMGEGLKKVAGSRLELVLYKLSSTPLKGVLLGTGVTAVIQSSSATSVMVVGFVNSGMMQGKQAIGVVMGAILGTSITGWILCLSDLSGGSGWVELLSTATRTGVVPIVGIILRMAGKKQSTLAIGNILMGFAVLMFGMSAMSDAVAPLKESEAFTGILTSFSNPFLGILVVFVYTSILQSASAAVGSLQALAITGAVTFEVAFPIIMGIAMGTSEAAGYVDGDGNITGWLNELAFLPVGLRPAAPVDPWSGDRGVGERYFSQEGVIRLAAQCGLAPEGDTPAQRLRWIQDRAEAGDGRALEAFFALGRMLGQTLRWYRRLLGCENVLLLGRVADGAGGECRVNACRAELAKTGEGMEIFLPEESFRRVGQAAAAAMLEAAAE